MRTHQQNFILGKQFLGDANGVCKGADAPHASGIQGMAAHHGRIQGNFAVHSQGATSTSVENRIIFQHLNRRANRLHRGSSSKQNLAPSARSGYTSLPMGLL